MFYIKTHFFDLLLKISEEIPNCFTQYDFNIFVLVLTVKFKKILILIINISNLIFILPKNFICI